MKADEMKNGSGKDSIARKFAMYIILFSSLMATLATILQLYSDYRRDSQELHNQMEYLGKTHLSSVIYSLWIMDLEQLNLLCNQLAMFPHIQFVEIRKGERILASAGQIVSKNSVSRLFRLDYTYRNKGYYLGRLEIIANLDSIYQRLWEKFAVILVTNAFKTFAVAIFIFLTFQRLVGRHLSFLSHYVQDLMKTGFSTPLVLPRASLGFDELDHVTGAINSMRVQLGISLKELQGANRQMALEIEKRQASEAQAQQRTLELETMINQMTDSVLVYDVKGAIVFENPAAKSLLLPKRKVDPTASQPTDSVVPPRIIQDDEGSIVQQALMQAFERQANIQKILTLKDSQGSQEKLIQLNVALIRDPQGVVVGAVSVGRDITELMALDRLKDQFLRVVAHELKTPITIIKGYVQLIEMKQAQHLPVDPNLAHAIRVASDGLLRIVEDILTVSLMQVGRYKVRKTVFDLRALLADNALVKSQYSPHRILLADGPPLLIYGDPKALDSAFTRLLDNAIKFSPAGGKIEVSGVEDAGDIMITVRDFGVGIPRSKQDRLFQSFYRAHTDTAYDYGGLGTGLFIARHILEEHGGSLSFQSEENCGSVFVMRLPKDL
jgi:signal transduction histidine kinase